MRCITSRNVVFNEPEMTFKKTDGVSRNVQIFEDVLEHEEILVEVDHVDVELCIPDQVEEEAQDAEDIEEVEETADDYLLVRDRLRKVIKPP